MLPLPVWLEHLYLLAKPLLPLTAGISIAMLLVSLFLLPLICLKLPTTYFSASIKPSSYTLTSIIIMLARNLLALLLLCAGVAMLFLPGQGLLTLFIALVVASFPGKYRLERYLIRQPGIFKSINWIRKRYHKPLLIHPDPDKK